MTTERCEVCGTKRLECNIEERNICSKCKAWAAVEPELHDTIMMLTNRWINSGHITAEWMRGRVFGAISAWETIVRVIGPHTYDEHIAIADEYLALVRI